MTNKYTVLYAEDDLDDVFFVQECFKKFNNKIELLRAENGVEALQLLEQLHQKGTSPCLIILDINMPVMDGRQALIKIKQNSNFKNLPVVLFTTSNSKLDKDFAVKWGADFLTKPLKYSEVEELAEEFARRCDFEMNHK
jgi:CheY-like chemotaxis protein